MRAAKYGPLVMWTLLSCLSGTLAFANGDGNVIGNGGGCAELILRASFNRLPHHTRALLMDNESGLDATAHAAIKKLLADLDAGAMESRLVFSGEKYLACIEARGFSKFGICLAPQTDDHHFYIDYTKLYSRDGQPLVNKNNVVQVLSRLSLERAGAQEPTLTMVTNKLQALGSKSWIDTHHPDSDIKNMHMLFTREMNSIVPELIFGDGVEYYQVSDLLKKRDPCHALGSSLLKWAAQDPWWSVRSENRLSLSMSGTFSCRNGQTLRGRANIVIALKDSGSDGARIATQPTLSFQGLDTD